MDESLEAVASLAEGSSVEESKKHSPTTASSTTPIPPPNFKDIPKILAKDVELEFLVDFACRSVCTPDLPDRFRYALGSVTRRQATSAEEWRKKQAKIDKEKQKSGLEMLDESVAVKVKEQDRVRIFRHEQEVALGSLLVFRSCRPPNRSLFKEPDPVPQSNLQNLIEIVQSEVGDNRKFYLTQPFCLKRHSDVFANPVRPCSVVLDERHQDLSIFQYPAVPYTAMERQSMDFMSCLSSDSESRSDTWIKNLGMLVATKQEFGQPFSTRIKLYLINRPVDSQQMENLIFEFEQFFPRRGPPTWLHNRENQGIWSTLRIGMELDVYAIPARLYQFPSQASTIAQRRAILQHIYANMDFVQAFATDETVGLIDLETFYSHLLPPPPLPPAVLDSLQPLEMRTPLLPFQRRSVAWLIQREQTTDVERTASYNSETWEKLSIGMEAESVDIAYSRLTGKALPIEVFPEWAQEGRPVKATAASASFSRDKDQFGLSALSGSMLCEEMG